MVQSKKTLFVLSLGVVILAFSTASGLSTNENSPVSSWIGVDASTNRSRELRPKYLQKNAGACRSNADCQNGGVCWTDLEEGNYCECRDGTSGDFCEIVDECVENPPKCGNALDVLCVYDIEKKATNCKCNNDSKRFDSYLKKCRVPCTSDEDCGKYFMCIENDDNNLMFCHCSWGIGGDRCTEAVDECKERGLDCGNNPNVTCRNGGNDDEAVCYCDVGGWSVAYDYEAKECRTCDCDSYLGCRFYPGGIKTCYCETKQQYQIDGKCKECECGYGSTGCKLQNGTKVCDCWEPYLDNGAGLCEKCDCGSNNDKCAFKNGKKICSCKQDSIEVNGTCRKNCEASSVECKHGGKCVDSVCKCLPGTKGDVCEVIDGCETKWDQRTKCGYEESAYCDFNTTTLEMYCRCKNKDYVYDSFYKKCKKCDCGPNGDCSFDYGDRKCDCKKGFAEKPDRWYGESQCERCDCGPRSTKCFFSDYETKQCQCEDGFIERNGICLECDCGSHGKCSFDNSGKKVCDCNYKFLERNGICYACDCGFYGKCEFDRDGRKICNCTDGYGDKYGECIYCGCDLNYVSISCTFFFGQKKCLCPEGYTEEYDSCVDIDECQNKSACPPKSICKNTAGDYTCTCEDGYRPLSTQQDIKHYGCTDIDECWEMNACPYRDTTECVNTEGGYYCYCKNGYYNKFSQYIMEMEGCKTDQTGWRIGYIILIVVFIFVLSGLSIAIIRKRWLSS